MRISLGAGAFLGAVGLVLDEATSIMFVFRAVRIMAGKDCSTTVRIVRLSILRRGVGPLCVIRLQTVGRILYFRYCHRFLFGWLFLCRRVR